MGENKKTLVLENTLEEILACQTAEIESLSSQVGVPERIMSIQRDILRCLEAFVGIVEFAGTVTEVSEESVS